MKGNGKIKSKIACLLLFSGLLYSCQTTKFVPENEYLLDKVKIKSDVPDYKSSELSPYLKQRPNFKMFGLNKTMLQVYSLAGKRNTWLNRLIKRMGEEPVIFDSLLVYKTENEFRKLLINKGYIHSDVSSAVTFLNKKAEVTYHIHGNDPYRIQRYDVTQIDTMWTQILGDPQIKEGMLFDRYKLDAERDRLTALLQNNGYFAFTKDQIAYDADSAFNKNSVDLELKIRVNDTMPAARQFYYDKVAFYLDYDPLKIANLSDYPKQDSILQNGYTIFYTGKKPSLKPATLLNHCLITPGQRYSQLSEEETYSAFSSLRALNNVHIQFNEKLRNDSTFLDVALLAMSARKQAVSLSLEGTNTVGDLGVAVGTNYTHRNLFRASETFNFHLRGAYEMLSDLSDHYLELGGEANIHIPKFMFPFLKSKFLRRMRTSTEFALSYNYQTRPEYDRTLSSGFVRYQWQGREKSAARHQFDIIDINYLYLPRIDKVFFDNLPTNARYFGYTNQFIVGMSYSYNARALRFSLESAGNVLYGLSSGFNWDKDAASGSYQLLGTNFAQFVKGDFDYSKKIILDKQNSIAWRIGGGIGVPYGNSKMLPFEKRYYSGGANSVRAWSVRELGPGSYQPNASTTFYNQTGDVKLDLNIEYRTHFFWKLEVAAFVDAGNSWTIRDYEGQEGGKFKFNKFYEEIALGYGLGLRLDFDYFLIRFDCGEKAYDPAKRGKDRWTVLHPNFGENFAWHIAVGYPF
ncbi:membrane protein [Bacteroidia bacterium]|nr:membrane protein [Bacteroidia bacterium]